MNSQLDLVAVGDIFINGVLANLICHNGCVEPFAMVLDAMANSEIKFGNLEGPLSTKGAALEKCCLYSIPEAIESLAGMGFNVFSVANNHIFDYGCEAFEDTCSMLKRKRIACVGAGHDIREATTPAIIEIKGIRVGFLGYSWNFIESINAKSEMPGTAPLKKKLIIKNVKNLKSQVDIVVVSIHWSYEQERYPLPYQRRIAHSIIDAGASIILGHHPHVLQGIEEYKSGIIVYSLGNFIFPDFNYKQFHLLQKEENKESVIFRCTLSKKRVEQWSVLPVKSNENFQPVPQNNNLCGRAILNNIVKLSEALRKRGYWHFWMKHRIRKDLPQILGTNICYKQKLKLYRFGLKIIKKMQFLLSFL